MKALLLLAIRFYQRFISPHKGYACAYRVHTGRAGCSGLAYRAIRRRGAWRGLLILRQRLHRCAHAHRLLTARRRPPLAQAGFCDSLAVDLIGNLVCMPLSARSVNSSCSSGLSEFIMMACATGMYAAWMGHNEIFAPGAGIGAIIFIVPLFVLGLPWSIVAPTDGTWIEVSLGVNFALALAWRLKSWLS